jgi:hypothetical protein
MDSMELIIRGFAVPGSLRWLLNRAALFCFVALRVVAGPLAEATPPDPTWIAGIYDDDDFDEIVTQLASLASVCDWSATPAVSPESGGGVPPAGARPVAAIGCVPRHDRAPPLA